MLFRKDDAEQSSISPVDPNNGSPGNKNDSCSLLGEESGDDFAGTGGLVNLFFKRFLLFPIFTSHLRYLC